MSETAGYDRRDRRSSSRKSLAEATLPQEYLDKLEEKRKQLDESIHKYIAAKERDYKQFQKELRQQYKISQGQDGRNDVAKRRGSASEISNGSSAQLEEQRVSAVDTLLMTAGREPARSVEGGTGSVSRSQGHHAKAQLEDRRASVEREKDFLGLFTPEYLPALNAKDVLELQRSTSAPSATSEPVGEPSMSSIERASSDSVARAKGKRPSHLTLVERNSSSGSSADGKLTSALRSPTQRSKQKRVSLAVGDSIVAPSDSVPTALSHHTTSSHSRKRSSVPEREFPVSPKKPSTEDEPADLTAASANTENPQAGAIGDHHEINESPPMVKSPSPMSSPRPNTSPTATRLDPDGDLFDLEAENDGIPIPQIDGDLSDSAIESDDEITGRVEPVEVSREIIAGGSGEVRYDPTNGLIPEPEDEDEDSAVPYLAFGPTSAIAPKKPGFRRPSVINDPVYVGGNYKAAERDAVEHDVYGSSFNKPTITGSFTAGSLGESYMAQHAEEMMKLRTARQQAQVKS